MIDTGYDSNTAMSFLGELGSFSATQTNFINGERNKYIFSMQSNIPMYEGDRLSFVLPPELGAPSNSQSLNCTAIFGFTEIQCTISGQAMEVEFKKMKDLTGTFQWSVENIMNPISTKPSSSFKNIIITDRDLYQVAAYS